MNAGRRRVVEFAMCSVSLVMTACGGDEGSTGPTLFTGTIALTTQTVGGNPDPDGYAVLLDGGFSGTIGIDASLMLNELSPGDHQVELTNVAANCTVDVQNPRTLTVLAGQVRQEMIGVTCRARTLVDRIVFTSSNQEIYAVGTDGSDPVNLSNHPEGDGSPAVSPDGTRILFHTSRHGDLEIYVMDADGTNQTRLTNNLVPDYFPSWSPDGSRVLFANAGPTGHADVYAMNPDGTGVVNLTNTPTVSEYSFAWSPDGSRIAYGVSDEIGGIDLYVMNADGSNPINLTPDSGVNFFPAWSPDGLRIAFTSDRDDFMGDIFVMNADGTNQVNITPGVNGTDSHASWSPDGTRISFHTQRTGNLYEVFIMNADGSSPHRVSDSLVPGIAATPQGWSP